MRKKTKPKHVVVRNAVLTLKALTAAVTWAAIAVPAWAQTWPVKPVRIIVPFPPGQAADIITRAVGDRLSPVLGQQIVVDNRPGAGASLGTELAAKAVPDGYTFLAGGSAALAINPHLYKVGYDTLRDFAPITQIVGIAMVFVSTPALPVKNLQDLIRLAKQKPGEITYGSSGSGSTSHLVMAVMASQSGIKLVHIPYKGAVPALTDLMAGQVMVVADTIPVIAPYVQSGRMRALAMSTIKRAPQMPDLPTADEQGIKGFDLMTWTSFVAPAAVPAPILDRMSVETIKIIQQPEMNKKLVDMGFTPVASNREQFAAFLHREHAAWQKAVQISGAKAE